MTRKTYLLVSPSGNLRWLLAGGTLDRGPLFSRLLNEGDEVYSLDEGVAFIKTRLAIDAIAERLGRTEVSKDHFFIVDISDAGHAGVMVPRFWDFLKAIDKVAAAE